MVPATIFDTVARWVQLHHASLYRYAYRLTGSQADAEDLTQQTFLIALENGGSVRDEERVRSWLFTVLRNRFWKQRRRQRPVVGHEEFDWGELPDPATDPQPDPFAHLPCDQAALQSALQELHETFRLVQRMFYFEELSYRQIAAQLQVPVGTVMSRLARGREHLRARLAAVADHELPWSQSTAAWRGTAPALGN
ncbi:MAG: RNA polymerase sigma factor [Planctomycetota bacterium]